MSSLKENAQRENKMGTTPMLRLIVTMSLPAMVSMMVQAMYNVVDSYFVAQVSEKALTAVSLVFPVQMLLVAVGVGTSVGINSLVARRLGEGRRDEANSAATHGLFLGVINWIIFAIVGLLLSRPFITAFAQGDQELLEMGVQYMSIVCVASFGSFIEMNVEKTLQATGNMMWPMVSQLIGAVTNIILDPIFIFGMFGVPKMGVAGAAVATVIGQMFGMATVLIVLFTQSHEISIKLRGFRVNWLTVKNIYAVGFPSIIMQAIGSVMLVTMNAILLTYSTTAVAFFGIYFKLQSFVFMPVFGLTQGTMPIMGYNFGARKRLRLVAATRIGCFIAIVIMALGTVLFWALPAQMLSIFKASPAMLALGVPGLRIISICFIPAALGILFSTTFQALGHGILSLIVSVLRQIIVILPAAFLLASLSPTDVSAVWWAFPIAECFSLAASALMFRRLYKRVICKLDEPLPPMSAHEF